MSVTQVEARDRRGLTLIELVVVLVILIALAGIVVPMLPGMVARSHSSTGATNIGEIAKAIQLHEAMHNTHPNNYDSLINQAGDSLVDETEVLLLDDANANVTRIRAALNAVGITQSQTMIDSATGDAWQINTFEAYPETLAPMVLDGTEGSVVMLEEHLEEDLNLPLSVMEGGDTTSDVLAYVAFGVGALNSAVGRTMVEAPVHPGSGPGISPTTAYSRYIAIYAIPQVGPARLATVAAMHGDHLEGLGAHLEEYHELVTQ